MSYILDALRKSDQQRQRGAAPTLQTVPVPVAVAAGHGVTRYVLFATVLLSCGMAIGWMFLEQEMPAAAQAPLAAPAVPVDAVLPPVQNRPMRQVAVEADGLHEDEVVALDALPDRIRQELPAMSVQLHAYASRPNERLVSINSIRLREGGYLMAGLKLEQITPDGMVFSYKGYRFRREARQGASAP